MKSFLVVLLFILCMPLAGQTPTFEELEFEPDSITSPYKPAGKNNVFIRSKRGTSGVNKTPAADAILTAEVSEIVLVFSELEPSAIAEREEANRERWENLLKTYPELFQFSTTYKNLCQCKNNGDSAAFKRSQGFYVYYAGAETKAEEKRAEERKPAAPEVVVAEKPSRTKEAPATREAPAKKEKEKKEKKQKEEPAREPEAPVSEPKEAITMDMPKATVKKKAGYSKPKKSKDLKACRPACYENGDDDLNTFFKDNIVMTKKQRRQAKSAVPVLKLQLNFDGSIKKALIAGENAEINQLVMSSVQSMNLWNPTVKNGVTIKSEVKITLKYDKETKAMRPFEVMVTPRLPAKCKCASDAEIFGSE